MVSSLNALIYISNLYSSDLSDLSDSSDQSDLQLEFLGPLALVVFEILFDMDEIALSVIGWDECFCTFYQFALIIDAIKQDGDACLLGDDQKTTFPVSIG